MKRLIILLISIFSRLYCYAQIDSLSVINKLQEYLKSVNYKGNLNINIKSVDQSGGQTAFIITNIYHEKFYSDEYKKWLFNEILVIQKKNKFKCINIGSWTNLVSPTVLQDLTEYLENNGVVFKETNRVYIELNSNPHIGVDAYIEDSCFNLRVGSIPKK